MRSNIEYDTNVMNNQACTKSILIKKNTSLAKANINKKLIHSTNNMQISNFMNSQADAQPVQFFLIKRNSKKQLLANEKSIHSTMKHANY